MARRNASLYFDDGKTNTINVNNVGRINEIKYPNRNNYESLVDFIQPVVNVIIKRGIPRRIKTQGPMRRSPC